MGWFDATDGVVVLIAVGYNTEEEQAAVEVDEEVPHTDWRQVPQP